MIGQREMPEHVAKDQRYDLQQQRDRADARQEAERDTDDPVQEALKQHAASDLLRGRAHAREDAVHPALFRHGDRKGIADHKDGGDHDDRDHHDADRREEVAGLAAERALILQKVPVPEDGRFLREIREDRVHIVAVMPRIPEGDGDVQIPVPFRLRQTGISRKARRDRALHREIGAFHHADDGIGLCTFRLQGLRVRFVGIGIAVAAVVSDHGMVPQRGILPQDLPVVPHAPTHRERDRIPDGKHDSPGRDQMLRDQQLRFGFRQPTGEQMDPEAAVQRRIVQRADKQIGLIGVRSTVELGVAEVL